MPQRRCQSAISQVSFKAVPKCPSIEAKRTKAVLKLIFLTKANEVWRRDYSSKNASNDAFHFSASIIEFEFQPIGFLVCHFFITFIGKLTEMLILALFSRILDG